MQNDPTKCDISRPVWELLSAETAGNSKWREALQARMALGQEKYGTTLHSFNGRDACQDALEELLDCQFYLAQMHMEGRISRSRYNEIAALVQKAGRMLMETRLPSGWSREGDNFVFSSRLSPERVEVYRSPGSIHAHTTSAGIHCHVPIPVEIIQALMEDL
jgi:hypothetical protein